MDIKDYISSGIIERYVLDDVSPQEKQEVECMSHIYPEINQELVTLQENIEALAIANARKVPAGIKEKLMAKITGLPQEDSEQNSEAKVITLAPSKSDNSIFKFAIAASVIFAVLGYMLYFSASSSLESSRSKIAQSEEMIESLTSTKQKQTAILNHISNPSTKEIDLEGTDGYPRAKAKVFWNANTNQVYAVLDGLNELPKEKQYQIWAIVDGKPLDMGVYEDSESLIEQIDLSRATAFAVTIEPKGGSKVPTLDQMVVVGQI